METNIPPETQQVEIIITYRNQLHTFFFDKNTKMIKLREAIQKKFAFPKISFSDIYAGNYLLNEIFDEIPLEKLNESFLSNKYNVLHYTEKDPFTVYKSDKNLEDFKNYHKNTVEKYLEFYDVDSDLKECYKDMSALSSNLQKMYDDMCREEEYLKKKGLLSLHDQLSLKLEQKQKKKVEMEAYLDRSFLKILELKKAEKEAIKIVKENKKLVSVIHQNNLSTDKKRKIINNLKTHRIN
jgi:hypothetical protein